MENLTGFGRRVPAAGALNLENLGMVMGGVSPFSGWNIEESVKNNIYIYMIET